RAPSEQAEHVRDAASLDCELVILLVELFCEAFVAIEKERPEAEELHLFGVLVVREDVLEIKEPSRLGRAPVAHAKCDLRVTHFRERRGNGRRNEPEHGPSREMNEE